MNRLTALFPLLLVACVVPDNAQPTTTFGFDVTSAYVHRGMVQNENGSALPNATISLPAKERGTLLLSGEGAVDLSNDTGDAWLPDGHAGRFSSLEASVLYEQRLGESSYATFGMVSYNLPNGTEFPNGERGATTEVMAEFGTVLLGLEPFASAHYDFDEVEGLYAQVGLGKTFPLGEAFSLAARASLGWMDEAQADWNYAQTPEASGFADARATLRLGWQVSDSTALHVEGGYSTVVEEEFSDWIESIGIDPDQSWLLVGIQWSFGSSDS